MKQYSLGVLLLASCLAAGPAGAVQINEIRIDQTGTDVDEYFELSGTPGQSLAGMWYVVIGDGAAGSGVVEEALDLTGLSIQPDGYIAVRDTTAGPVCSGYDANRPLNFENSDNVTHLLVTGFSGAINDDLDTNDDGVLDSTPWTSIVDCVALIETVGTGDQVYCDTRVGPDGSFVPGHVFRCGSQWAIGLFDPVCTNDTPGADNTPQCGNLSPEVFNLVYRPCAPSAGEQVTLTVAVTDPNTDLASVRAFYKLSNAALFDSLNMSVQMDSLYTATLPGQADLSLVQFYVQARDAQGNVTSNPSDAPSFTRSYRVGIVPIATIQSDTLSDTCLSSALLDQAVNIEGIVTHEAYEYSDDFFYVQDGTGPNSGIKIFAPGSAFVPNKGDRVRISGYVDEYRCATEVVMFADCGEVIGSGAVVPRTLTNVSEIANEVNESMLVRLQGPINVATGFDTTIVASNTYIEFQVEQGGNTAWVGDDTFFPDGVGYSVVPSPGLVLDDITGVVGARLASTTDSTTILRLEPRRDNDVNVNWTDVGDLEETNAIRVFQLRQNHPNPFNPATTIEFEVPRAGIVHVSVYDANGKLVRRLMSKQYFGPSRDRVSWNGLDQHGRAVPSGLYFYQLESDGFSATRKMLLLK